MALEVFYSYAHQDERLRDELNKHLSLLERSGLIIGWHDRRIGAGDDWRNQIDTHVRSAQIILLLISSDFLASDYCYDVEMKVALERHARQEAVVIPIILRPVDWSLALFAGLQALPRDAKAVTEWTNRDEAFADIAREITAIVQRFSSPAPTTTIDWHSEPNKLSDGYIPRTRVLDAAIPSHIVKDVATELLVLIHLPESEGLKGVLLADEDAQATPEDVRSKPFDVVFPLGPDGRPGPLKAIIKLTSPDFYPRKQEKNLLILPAADSEVAHFMLTPTHIGQLRVLIELQWEDILRGSRRLLTECVAEATTLPRSPGMNLVRIPLAFGEEPGDAKAMASEATAVKASPPMGPAPDEYTDEYTHEYAPDKDQPVPDIIETEPYDEYLRQRRQTQALSKKRSRADADPSDLAAPSPSKVRWSSLALIPLALIPLALISLVGTATYIVYRGLAGPRPRTVRCDDGLRPRSNVRDFTSIYSPHTEELEALLKEQAIGSAKLTPNELQQMSDSLQTADEFRKSVVAGYNACAISTTQFAQYEGRFRTLDALARQIYVLVSKPSLDASEKHELDSLVEQHAAASSRLRN